jgi:glycosyltransferase involved in cell wall biosynthesis
MTKVLISVFNNLLTDQRIEKVCHSLHENGYQVELIGCSWGGLPKMERPYPFTRIEIHSKSLKWAYLEFNVKLYVLLKRKIDKNTILVANDLDTILPNLLLSKKNKIPVVYDSHEIFTEMPAIQGRWSQKIWRLLESYCVPKLNYMMTANESYAQWYANRYAMPCPIVVRNLPKRKNITTELLPEKTTKIILYQGAINPSRGLDKIILAMAGIENAELWIAGNGPKLKEYQSLIQQLQV